tara:strand:+ start:2518 stop:3939 length:1422 start_codon:yes stop_codon:yes gene_type:complete
MAAVDVVDLPDGGLASFLTSNLDELDDRALAFGRQGGLNSFGDVAQQMVSFGRNGDDKLIHAKTGELVVSPEILQENPELVEKLAESFQNSDVDMARYIVGNDNNSINPFTGQPEFFFKKIVSGVKKLAKKAFNVVKKIAPVILPFAINAIAPGLGSVASGALGAGLGSLIQGKSVKDSLKSALIGGAIGGLTAGFKGMTMEGGSFGEGFRQFGMPKGMLGGTGEPIIGGKLAEQVADQAAGQGSGFLGNAVENTVQSGKDFYNYLMPDASSLQQANYEAAQKAMGADAFEALSSSDKLALFQDSAPTFMQQYGKAAAAAGAGAAALGAFDPPEQDELNVAGYDPDDTAEKRLEENKEKYSVGVAGAPTYLTIDDVMVEQPPFSIASNYLYQPLMAIPPVRAAAGGEMEKFPRRSGAIAGAGTETSDDVPAMLSDGEFVMTARAVRGLGNGSRKAGIKKMYDLMSRFEGGVRA